MNKDTIEFIKKNYRLDKTKKKINSFEIKVEITFIKEQIQILFPIMNDNKKEKKIFNNIAKEKSLYLINEYFEDLQILIDKKNFKVTLNESEELYKYCFFYKNKNFVFSIENKNENINFLYVGKQIALTDLKSLIFERLFGIKIKETLNNSYKNNKNLTKNDLDIIKILLI